MTNQISSSVRHSAKERKLALSKWHACFEASRSPRALAEPTKQQLRDMLAEAARNTAALPIPPEIEEFDKAMRPLVKGRRP